MSYPARFVSTLPLVFCVGGVQLIVTAPLLAVGGGLLVDPELVDPELVDPELVDPELAELLPADVLWVGIEP
jgi:hypothetical protein